MLGARLLLSGVFALATAALWTAVGLAILRQRLPHAGGIARRRFAIWWIALAAYTALNALLSVMVATVGAPGATLLYAAVLSFAFLIVAMFWGLMSYMAYLLTGRPGAFPVMTVAYAIQLAALVVIVFVLAPTGAHDAGWGVALEYARGDFAAANVVFALVFLLPPLAASGAYLTLWIRIRDPPARLRIALVGGSIFAWVVLALASAATPGDADGRQIALKLLSLLVALVALWAYAPPSFLRERLPHVHGEVARPGPSPEEREARRRMFAQRVSDLV